MAWARHSRTLSVQSTGVEGFDAWVTYLFDRPPGRQAETWWDDRPSEWLERYAGKDSPVAIAERIRHLFGNAGAILGPYSDDQVARGLTDIAGGGDIYVFGTKQLPRTLRTSGLRSIVTLFTEIFAARIKVEDAHQRPALESVCFMFFDMASIDLSDDTVLDVLEDTLALPSVPCQRAALHGLGHAHFHVPQHVSAIVDRWLEKNPCAPQELRDYAAAARIGDVM